MFITKNWVGKVDFILQHNVFFQNYVKKSKSTIFAMTNFQLFEDKIVYTFFQLKKSIGTVMRTYRRGNSA